MLSAEGTPHACVLRVGSRLFPCPGRCPDRWRHRFSSPLRPFWKKGGRAASPKPIAGRGAAPPHQPRTRRGAEGNGRPFPRGQVWRSTPSRGFRGICSPRFAQSAIPRSLDCVPRAPVSTERPDHSGRSPPWAGRSAHAAAHGQGTCWQGGRPHSRQGMTPRPRPPGLMAGPDPAQP